MNTMGGIILVDRLPDAHQIRDPLLEFVHLDVQIEIDYRQEVHLQVKHFLVRQLR